MPNEESVPQFRIPTYLGRGLTYRSAEGINFPSRSFFPLTGRNKPSRLGRGPPKSHQIPHSTIPRIKYVHMQAHALHPPAVAFNRAYHDSSGPAAREKKKVCVKCGKKKP